MVYVTDRNGTFEIWLHKPGQPDRPLVTARDFPADKTRGFMGPTLSPNGTRVIYIPGNHDEAARQYYDREFGGVLIRPHDVHRTLDGRDLLVTHGDQYDLVVKHSAVVGARAAIVILNPPSNPGANGPESDVVNAVALAMGPYLEYDHLVDVRVRWIDRSSITPP